MVELVLWCGITFAGIEGCYDSCDECNLEFSGNLECIGCFEQDSATICPGWGYSYESE